MLISTSLLYKVIPSVAAALLAAFLTANFYKAKISEMEKDYFHQIVIASEEAREIEEELNTVKNLLEDETEQKNEQIQDLLSKYNRAVASGKRLRDPGKSNSSCVSNSPSSTVVNRENTKGGELSRESSEFLLSESARADRAVAQLKLCRDMYEKARTLTQETNESNLFLQH